MGSTIMIYGATGYSGRLIAAAASRRWSTALASGQRRLLLAGRDGVAVGALARGSQAETRVFALDSRDEVVRNLRGVDVLVNAAGPFQLTAERLAKAAITAKCNYVDINGQVEVVQVLDDLGRIAAQRGVTLVCAAGHMAAISDLLLYAALGDDAVRSAPQPLGAVRIALSRIVAPSRGSVATAFRSLREEVGVGRLRRDPEGDRTVLCHEPIGRLERTFDFGHRGGGRHICTAANFVDTPVALRELEFFKLTANAVETYVQAGAIERTLYQVGAIAAPLTSWPCVRAAAQAQIDLLPAGPSADERQRERHTVVLTIEDAFRRPLGRWAAHTPSLYSTTAELAVLVADKVANGVVPGWLTPAQALAPVDGFWQEVGEIDGSRIAVERT